MKDPKKTISDLGIKIGTALPLALMMSIIMSMGGIYQNILTNLLASDSANLYDTINNGIIVLSHSKFTDWFVAYYQSVFIIPSLLIVAFCVNDTKPKQAFVHSSVFVFLTLMVADYTLSECQNQEYDFLTSLISNLLGSPVIVGFILLSIDMSRSACSTLGFDKLAKRRITDTAVSLFIGISIAYFLYLVDRNVYAVSTSKIDLTVDIPANGFYSINRADVAPNQSEFGPFSVPSPNPERFSWVGFAKNLSIKLALDKNIEIGGYNIDVRLLDGCVPSVAAYRRALTQPATYSIGIAKNIKITVDDGQTEFSILENKEDNGKFSVSNQDVEMFTISESGHDKYAVTRFVDSPAEITHSSWSKSATYALSLANIDASDEKSTLKDRHIQLLSDGKLVNIYMRPNRSASASEEIGCRVFKRYRDNEYQTRGILSGIILSIRRPDIKPSGYNFETNNRTEIKGASGWLTVSDLERQNIGDYISSGSLQSLGIRAPVRELYLDGNKYDVGSSYSSVHLLKSKINGHIAEDGRLRFSGTSAVIYVNEARASLSRWEKLDIGYKLALLGLMPGAIFFALIRIKRVINSEVRYLL